MKNPANGREHTQCEQRIVAWEVSYDQDEIEMKLTQNDQFILQGRLSNPIAFCY